MLARVKEKTAKEEKRRKRAREDFTDLLRDLRDIHMDTAWEDAKPLLEKAPEYKVVSVQTCFVCLPHYMEDQAEQCQVFLLEDQ